MDNDEEEKEEEEELKQKEDKKSIKSKEKILDDSFRKAELLKKDPQEKKEKKIVLKKPFNKLGIIIVVIAIIGILFINYIPWLYINYETDFGWVEESFSYDDLNNYLIESEDIIGLFESTCYNCSDNSNSYIGLTLNDFTATSKLTLYIFVFLALLGIIFTIYVIIDRKKDFTPETFTIIHSIFVVLTIIVAIILIFLNVKFLSSHVLSLLNEPFINALGFEIVRIIFFMPYVIFLFSVVLLVIGITLIRINLNRAVNRFDAIRSKKSELSYKFGSNY